MVNKIFHTFVFNKFAADWKVMMDKYQVLKQIFGYDSFRVGQEELIDALLNGQDVLGIMPTGAGKSICYQVPALLTEGITLIISPLISLMKDQVNALTQAGVAAAYLNSSLSQHQYETALARARQGKYKIIYVAPERLMTESFTNFVQQVKIAFVIVDEAHCVSQWGHDFRSSYLDIKNFLAALDQRPSVGAFTATATEKVRTDIMTLLELQNPHVLVTGFDRRNLNFVTQTPRDKDRTLLQLMEERVTQSGIVYCSTRSNVEEVCELLNHKGFSATRYHAGLSSQERQQNQSDFVYDHKKIMVATNAFGMGIDKSNVSFVIHYNMPKNLESYYQEAGRAGRDGEPADCILLYSSKDVHINRFLITNSMEANEDLEPAAREAIVANELNLLKQMTFYCTTTECLRRFILRYFGESAPLYCGNCSNCNQNYDTLDITIDTQKIISCVARIERTGRPLGKTMIANILHGSSNAKILKSGYDKLQTYGIMSETSIRRIIYTMEYLTNTGYLTLSDDEYPVLRTNQQSLVGLQGETPLVMKLPKEKETYIPKKVKETETAGDPVLFEKLSALRTALAKEEGMPAYIVFSNAALRDMSQKVPVTDSEFLDVSGVGQAKLEKYGEAFMEVIRSYKEEESANK